MSTVAKSRELEVARYQAATLDDVLQQFRDESQSSRGLGDPRYIIDLLARVVRVSMETNRIVESLPSLNERSER